MKGKEPWSEFRFPCGLFFSSFPYTNNLIELSTRKIEALFLKKGRLFSVKKSYFYKRADIF